MSSNWDNFIERYFSEEEISNLKEVFARIMAKYNSNADYVLNDPEYNYAFKGHTACMLLAINNWKFDPEIKLRIEYYLDEGANEILPSKNKIAQMYLDIANKAINPKDKLMALDRYAELMGYTDDDKVSENQSTTGVMLITDNGSTLSWEEKLKQNQYELQKKADEMLGLNNDVKH